VEAAHGLCAGVGITQEAPFEGSPAPATYSLSIDPVQTEARMGRQTRRAPSASPNRPLALSAECWTDGVTAAFLAARPRGFCRLLDDDLDQDPRRMIAL
jgi:hypothetical protein